MQNCPPHRNVSLLLPPRHRPSLAQWKRELFSDWKGPSAAPAAAGSASASASALFPVAASGISCFRDTFSVLQSPAWVASGPLGTAVTRVLCGTEVRFTCWHSPRLTDPAQRSPRACRGRPRSRASLAGPPRRPPAPRSLRSTPSPPSSAPVSLLLPVVTLTCVPFLSKFRFPLHFLCSLWSFSSFSCIF